MVLWVNKSIHINHLRPSPTTRLITYQNLVRYHSFPAEHNKRVCANFIRCRPERTCQRAPSHWWQYLSNQWHCLKTFHSTSEFALRGCLTFDRLVSFVSAYIEHIGTRRKPPYIGGMKVASLSCNSVLIPAESAILGWCKIMIATKWYQFHVADKYGFSCSE